MYVTKNTAPNAKTTLDEIFYIEEGYTDSIRQFLLSGDPFN